MAKSHSSLPTTGIHQISSPETNNYRETRTWKRASPLQWGHFGATNRQLPGAPTINVPLANRQVYKMYPTTLRAETRWGGQSFNAIGKNVTGAAFHDTQSFRGMKIDITVLSYALYRPAIKKASQTEEASNVITGKFTNQQSTSALSQSANATSEDSGENIT